MITVDDREANEHPDCLELLNGDIPVQVDRLVAGDYAFLNRDTLAIGIERTTVNDLLGKIRTNTEYGSNRLEFQLELCSEIYLKVYLLVEDVFDHVGGFLSFHRQTPNGYFRSIVLPHTHYSTIISLLLRLEQLGIMVVSSPNFDCSMRIIRSIYKQETKPDECHTLFTKTRVPTIPTRLTNNPSVPKLMALCPRLPEKVAIRLIQAYGSIWNVLNADDKDLLQVEGFGKGLLYRLKKEVGISE